MTHYHDYQLIHETQDGKLEVCRECKKRLYTKLDTKGNTDRKYLEEHIRDTAQPNGKTGKIFAKYYGKVINTKLGPQVKKI